MTDYRVRRKVHAQGGSYLIAIPKIWAESNGIDGDSEVDLLFDGDGIVRIQPIETERHKSRSASR